MSKQLEKTKRLNKFWTAWNIIEALALLAAGVLAIIAGVKYDPQSAGQGVKIEDVVAFVIAAFVILDGILRVVLYFARYQKGDGESPVVIAGFEITVGVLLILLQINFAGSFMFTVVNFISILLMAMGALLLATSIFTIARHYAKLFMPVLEIFFSAVIIGVGITIMVLYRNEDNNQFVYILTGSILCVAAVAIFIISFVTSSKAKKELAEAEKEERGEYQIVDNKSAHEEQPKPAEIVDVEVPEEPKEAISGPRAIGSKKDE